jgi:hypothetical protein
MEVLIQGRLLNRLAARLRQEKRINFTWDYPLHRLGLTYMLTPQNKADRLAGKRPVGQHIWLEWCRARP